MRAGASGPWRPLPLPLQRSTANKAFKTQPAAAAQPSGGLNSGALEAYVAAGTITQAEASQYTREQLEFLVRKRTGLASPSPAPQRRGSSPYPRRASPAAASVTRDASQAESYQAAPLQRVGEPTTGAQMGSDGGGNSGGSSSSSSRRRARWTAEGLAEDGAALSTNGFVGEAREQQGPSAAGQPNGQLPAGDGSAVKRTVQQLAANSSSRKGSRWTAEALAEDGASSSTSRDDARHPRERQEPFAGGPPSGRQLGAATASAIAASVHPPEGQQAQQAQAPLEAAAPAGPSPRVEQAPTPQQARAQLEAVGPLDEVKPEEPPILEAVGLQPDAQGSTSEEQPEPQAVQALALPKAERVGAELPPRELPQQAQQAPSWSKLEAPAIAASKAEEPREMQAIQLLLEMEAAEAARRKAGPSLGLVTTQAAVSMTVVGFLTGIFLLADSGLLDQVPRYLEPFVPQSVRQAAEVVPQSVQKAAEAAGAQREVLLAAVQEAVQGAVQEVVEEAAQLKRSEVGLGLRLGPLEGAAEANQAGLDTLYSYAAGAAGAAVGFASLLLLRRAKDKEIERDDIKLPEPDPMTYWVGATVGATAGFTGGLLASLLLLPPK